MSIALNGDGIISGVSSISNPSDITVGTGASVFSPAANTLALGTNGSERVRVGAAGSVGIGTDNPRGRQEIYITGAANGSTTNAIVIDNDNSSNNDNLATGIVWKRKGNSSSYDYSRIDSVRTGTHDTDIVFSTNYGTTLYEELRIKANGGITFNGDTAAANALDDYEEGTWTPTIFGASVSGTTTYDTFQRGNYVKIGSLVSVRMFVRISGATGSGQLKIGGFPFTSSEPNDSGCFLFTSGLNWGGGTCLWFDFPGNRTAGEVYYLADDASATAQSITNESSEFRFSFSYITSS